MCGSGGTGTKTKHDEWGCVHASLVVNCVAAALRLGGGGVHVLSVLALPVMQSKQEWVEPL